MDALLPSEAWRVVLSNSNPNYACVQFQEAVNVSLKNLLTFSFVEERVQKGELELYGMHYDFHDGKLTSWKAAPAKATVNA